MELPAAPRSRQHVTVLSHTKQSNRGKRAHPVGVWRELTPGYAAPERFNYTEEAGPTEPTAVLHMRVNDSRLVCDGVTVQPPSGRTLQASDLRAVNVGEMLTRVPKAATAVITFNPFVDDQVGTSSWRDDRTEIRVHQHMFAGDDGAIRRGADKDAWLVAEPEPKRQPDPKWARLKPDEWTEELAEELVAAVRRREAERPAPRLVDNPGYPGGGRVDPREYETAAEAYRRAKHAGDPKPMVAVMDALGLDAGQRQTAWRRVKEAKRRGLPID